MIKAHDFWDVLKVVAPLYTIISHDFSFHTTPLSLFWCLTPPISPLTQALSKCIPEYLQVCYCLFLLSLMVLFKIQGLGLQILRTIWCSLQIVKGWVTVFMFLSNQTCLEFVTFLSILFSYFLICLFYFLTFLNFQVLLIEFLNFWIFHLC